MKDIIIYEYEYILSVETSKCYFYLLDQAPAHAWFQFNVAHILQAFLVGRIENSTGMWFHHSSSSSRL